MISRNNIIGLYFLIYYSLVINFTQADVISDTLKDNGWARSKDYEINIPSDTVLAESYVKTIGGNEARIIYLASKKKLCGSKAQPIKYESPLFFFDNEIHTIHWMTGYHLTLGGINFSVNDEKETSAALHSFQTLFSSNPKELAKIRRYKGAFGPIDVGGRALQSVKFAGNNLFLTFLDGGQEATLELGPGFDYVSSTVANGRKINPAAVVSSPMRSLADVHRKIEEDGAKMMAAEREKQAAKTADPPPAEKQLVAPPVPHIPNQSKITENPQLPVPQGPTPKKLDSAKTTNVDAIGEGIEDFTSWIIAALAIFSVWIIWIFIRKSSVTARFRR